MKEPALFGLGIQVSTRVADGDRFVATATDVVPGSVIFNPAPEVVVIVVLPPSLATGATVSQVVYTAVWRSEWSLVVASISVLTDCTSHSLPQTRLSDKTLAL
ncbi:MAG: hypothetical protein UT32_C0006G0016 [Parcubacteria group bacterium GW2011_GWC2_39_14]|nr:MAG: hypothetical protein UT32_C0006G0016 [Parcubacteria group bacterium GW2011_GWC2_39_14]KKR54804.1 MAG: hypothetical protein UT91_C0009G0016 [Parcubacteria group bacterium GW2011_GWA2_40_23]